MSPYCTNRAVAGPAGLTRPLRAASAGENRGRREPDVRGSQFPTKSFPFHLNHLPRFRLWLPASAHRLTPYNGCGPHSMQPKNRSVHRGRHFYKTNPSAVTAPAISAGIPRPARRHPSRACTHNRCPRNWLRFVFFRSGGASQDSLRRLNCACHPGLFPV